MHSLMTGNEENAELNALRSLDLTAGLVAIAHIRTGGGAQAGCNRIATTYFIAESAAQHPADQA